MSEPYELPDDRPYDASDVEQVREKRLSAKELQRQLDAMTVALMDTRQGRAWMWNLLTATKVFQSSFSNRALEMAFAEGQRNVGLLLMADITRVAPANYVKMAQENGAKDE